MFQLVRETVWILQDPGLLKSYVRLFKIWLVARAGKVLHMYGHLRKVDFSHLLYHLFIFDPTSIRIGPTIGPNIVFTKLVIMNTLFWQIFLLIPSYDKVWTQSAPTASVQNTIT